jgi:cephalosporin-C deacetylase-like acetyl esterase
MKRCVIRSVLGFLTLLWITSHARCTADPAPGNKQASLPDSLASIFRYTPVVQPAYAADISYITPEGVTVEYIEYITSDSFTVDAILVMPDSLSASPPLIVFHHWSEGDKREFLDEAVSYAGQGAVCVLPSATWLCPGSPFVSFKRQGFDLFRQSVMNVRTAIDLAQFRFHIDTTRIIYVGHSFGAQVGSILSGVDDRIDYFVFMGGICSITKSALQSTDSAFIQWRTTSPSEFAAWMQRVGYLDGELYLPYKKAQCLVQVANQDEFVTPAENDAFIACIPEPKKIKRYDTKHELNHPDAIQDRKTWIFERIK